MKDDDLFESLYAGEQGVRCEETDDVVLSLTGRRLMVRGLPYELSKASMKSLFADYGVVERIETWKARRGSCTVDFADPRSASACLLALDGKAMGRTKLELRVHSIYTYQGVEADEPSDDASGQDMAAVPLNFSGRGSRADEEKQRTIERKFKHKGIFCELCGSRKIHFTQGCFLLDKAYHRRLVDGDVEAPEQYALALVAAEEEEEKKVNEEESPERPPSPHRQEPPLRQGRGRGSFLPSWMKDPELKAKASLMKAPAPSTHIPPPERRQVQDVASLPQEAEEPRNDDLAAALEMRQLSSFSVFWPLEGGLYIKFDYDSSRLYLCRAMPSGEHVQVDVTPPFDPSRSVDSCRLDVATDPIAAVERARALMRLNKDAHLPEILGNRREYDTVQQLELALLAVRDDMPPLPENWSVQWSRDHLAYYYYQTQTGDVSWERPQLHRRKRGFCTVPEDDRRYEEHRSDQTRETFNNHPRRRHRTYQQRGGRSAGRGGGFKVDVSRAGGDRGRAFVAETGFSPSSVSSPGRDVSSTYDLHGGGGRGRPPPTTNGFSSPSPGWHHSRY